jgi:hypothetical protein
LALVRLELDEEELVTALKALVTRHGVDASTLLLGAA